MASKPVESWASCRDLTESALSQQAMMEFQASIPAKFKDYNLGGGRGGPGGAFVPLFEELKR